jgi:hypothetical protein
LSAATELPPGLPVEVEFVRESKPNVRGVLASPLEYDARGFELLALVVPENLGFAEPFRYHFQRRWLNLDTVAEVRYLAREVLAADLERLARLHEGVRARMKG